MHPWGSPGSAITFGEGCGANGGNPNGCQAGEFDPNPYGTCCNGPKGGNNYSQKNKLSNVHLYKSMHKYITTKFCWLLIIYHLDIS